MRTYVTDTTRVVSDQDRARLALDLGARSVTHGTYKSYVRFKDGSMLKVPTSVGLLIGKGLR